ncbi:uncharacterized protein N0V96_004484 [Colletotrichum fioriniae]|uniref:uncharacterized protein n=1 Tax=Colletotrichum fioriniae TaxID=710243 RepID=UPI0032DB5B72|nr:hypothetical protein N0V96_004484 [Colletotrichum fioriniae]
MMNLLRLQSELQDLEQQLEDTREEDRNSTDPIRKEYEFSFRVMKQYAEDPDSIQYELLLEIGNKLEEYLIGQHSSSNGKVRLDDTRTYNEEKISRFGDIVLATLSAAQPTLAILILYFVQNMVHRIGLVIVLTMVFSVLFALLTRAKKAEIFAATAAFAAVEVVYIGSVASNDPVCVCSSSQA